jgi:hypothetical protein
MLATALKRLVGDADTQRCGEMCWGPPFAWEGNIMAAHRASQRPSRSMLSWLRSAVRRPRRAVAAPIDWYAA